MENTTSKVNVVNHSGQKDTRRCNTFVLNNIGGNHRPYVYIIIEGAWW